MSQSHPNLYLITPRIDDPADFRPTLAEACATGVVAVCLLRLAPRDERSLVNAVKELAPVAQAHDAALLVADPGREIDLATVVTRGGADGAHTDDVMRLEDVRTRLTDGRSVGAGGLRSKHDAMVAGERGASYVLFGEPRPDGFVPALEGVEERAAWWAEIFEIPCVAFAPDLGAIGRLAAAGADFVALGDAVWAHPDGTAAALREAAAACRSPVEATPA